MRAVTFANEDLSGHVIDHFVPVWHNQDPNDVGGYGRRAKAQPTPTQIEAYPVGGGGGNIRAYFLDSDGKIFHYIQGYWPAREFRTELDYALKQHAEMKKQKRSVSNHKKSLLTNLQSELKSMKAARKKLMADHPKEFQRPIGDSKVRKEHAAIGLRQAAYRTSANLIGQEAQPVLANLVRQNARLGIIA